VEERRMTVVPYYQNDGLKVTIYCDIAENVLPSLQNISLIVTSPPFNKEGHEGKRRKAHTRDAWKQREMNYGQFKDNLPETVYQAQQIHLLTLMHDALTDGGSVLYNHKLRVKNFKATHPVLWLLQTPFNLRQEIIWDRRGVLNIDPIRFYPSTERIYWMFKGDRPRYFNRDYANYKEVWAISPDTSNPHPAPYPLELAERCVFACGMPGDVLLDPFMGSGTTLLAGIKRGCVCIGIEPNKDFCDMAIARIERENYDRPNNV
jgi:site-specific DNA-methyltransferase (adenine-specific)